MIETKDSDDSRTIIIIGMLDLEQTEKLKQLFFQSLKKFKMMFSSKHAYSFQEIPNISLEDYLWEELARQTKDLEKQWLEMDAANWDVLDQLQKELQKKLYLDQIRFRIKEILFF